MRAIRFALAGTLVTAGLQILVAALLWAHQSAFTVAQAGIHPELSSVAIQDRVDGIIYGGLGVHLVLLVVYLALAHGILRGRNAARVRLTFLLVAGSVAGGVAAKILGGQVPSIRMGMVTVQAVSTAVRLGVVYLLWMTKSSRRHFAASSSDAVPA